jgi:methylated-DNA-[protein]-cysteine S-methyltransferase
MTFVYTAIESPVGHLYLAICEDKLCALSLGQEAKEKLFEQLVSMNPEAEIKESQSAFKIIIKQLNEYFTGQRTEFEIPLLFEGTDFQKSVWSELIRIPYGKTISYGDLANRIDKPGGMRAVGAANGQNPIPIIVPCHRVIAADGSLGGYTGGLEIKHKLLDLEQQKFTPTLF